MKLITLNIWGGRIRESLLDFLRQSARSIDVFCFQEVYNGASSVDPDGEVVTNIYSQIQNVLTEHIGFFSEAISLEERGLLVPYGIATFVKSDISVEQKTEDLFRKEDASRFMLEPGIQLWNRLLQSARLMNDGVSKTIFNVHGLYTGGGKGDGPERLEQSQKIMTAIRSVPGERILCGDFNLDPDTRSLSLLEDGMRNLIKENGITSTRSHFYPKEKKFADYILVSPDTQVKEFCVRSDVVSDHLPLYLEVV